MIKTFRGLLASGGQDRIRLQTIKGKVGYRIIKLQLFALSPGAVSNAEYVMKIYTELQTTIDATVNFSQNTLLAAGFLPVKTSEFTHEANVIFDQEIFNQDIYITQFDAGGGAIACNYYLELEIIPLDDAGAEYTTLKDLRS